MYDMNDEVILTVLYVRHGESRGNTREWMPDDERERDNPPLTDLGKKQAELLGERLSKGRLDAIYSSTFERAIDTANESAKRQGNMSIIILPDLMESGTAPDYPGMEAEEIRRKFPLAVPCVTEPTPTGGMLTLGKETTELCTNRAKRVIAFLRRTYIKGETVALFSHGGFSGYFISAVLKIPISDEMRFSSFNTGVTKIKFYESGITKLSFFNDTSHLFELENDLTYTM